MPPNLASFFIKNKSNISRLFGHFATPGEKLVLQNRALPPDEEFLLNSRLYPKKKPPPPRNDALRPLKKIGDLSKGRRGPKKRWLVSPDGRDQVPGAVL